MCTGLEVALLAGTAMSATGSLMQGYQNKKLMEFQAGQDEQQAKAELAAADIEAQNIRKAMKGQIGAARAAYGASGASANDGTPLIVERDIAEGGESDAMLALLGGRQRSSALRDQAAMGRQGGRMAMTAGVIGAGGTLLQGGYQASRSSGWRSQAGASGSPMINTSASGASSNAAYGNYA